MLRQAAIRAGEDSDKHMRGYVVVEDEGTRCYCERVGPVTALTASREHGGSTAR